MMNEPSTQETRNGIDVYPANCNLTMKVVLLTLFSIFVPLAAGLSAASPAKASTKFPIKPVDLICNAKKAIEAGIGTKDGGECLADDFTFCAAVVGPLGKTEFLNALGTFKLEDSWDIKNESFGFTVSPVQPNRVYWFSHQSGTMKADFLGAPVDETKEAILPPQCLHMDFDESGKVKEFGFYTVDRQYGNTGGLGGAFGFMYAAGRAPPIPEARPYKPSRRFRFFMWLGRLNTKFSKKKD